MTTITIRQNPGRSRFEVLDGAAVVGHASYLDDDGGSPLRIFYHTVINEAYGGRGLAGRLAAAALDETVAAGRLIVPVCPFIKSTVEKHPGYADAVVPPDPDIMQLLDAALAGRSRTAP